MATTSNSLRTHVGLLNPGGSYENSATFAIPFDFSGPYRVIVQTDIFNHVLEFAGENNNDSTPLSLNVTRRMADLEVTPGPIIVENNRLRLSWTVANIGLGDPNSRFWRDTVYASSNEILGDSDDVALRSVFISRSLPPTVSYNIVQSAIEVPFELSGTLHLFVVTDDGNIVDEGGLEANNVSSLGTIDADAL